MEKIKFILLGLLPAIAFASGTDNTFSEVYNTLNQYLTGSLGNVILIVCLLGVVIALAGFAQMKVMFPILVIAIIVRFGPTIISNMAGTSAEISTHQSVEAAIGNGLGLTIMLLLAGAVVALIFKNNKMAKRLKALENC
ncbi:MAG: hypothetical protein ORN24_05360 [Burkholderiales bacterium]|nr:hypothetical protein [Burkholderiales bacterium]